MRIFPSKPLELVNTTLCLLGFLFMLGCGGSYVNYRPVLDQKTIIHPDQGVVIARIVNTSTYPLPFNNLTITPENLNESKKIKPDELQALTPYEKGTTVFASQIPPGSYALKNILAWHFRGEYRYSNYIPADTKLGTFEVKAGQVTDLGTILYYPKPQNDKFLKILSRVPETANGEVLAKYFPFYNYQSDNIISWKDDGKSEERDSLIASIAQNPVTYQKRYLAPDKSVYFLAKLGVILKRNASGEWSLDGVDTNLNLNTIAQSKAGDVIVGGAEGKLFWKHAGYEWKDISLDYQHDIKELIFYDESTIDMVVDEGKNALIYRADKHKNSLKWKEMNRFNHIKGWSQTRELLSNEPDSKSVKKKKKQHRIAELFLRKLDGSHYIDISTQTMRSAGTFAINEFKTFGYDPITWETYTPESLHEMSTIIDSGAIKLGIKKAGFWDWDSRPEYYRLDTSTNEWMEIKRTTKRCSDGSIIGKAGCSAIGKKGRSKRADFSFRSLPFFKNELEAIVIANLSKSSLWTGERSKEVKILSTKDGGKTWIDTGNELPSSFCGSIVKEVTDRILLSCEGVSTDFYESFDDGANWQHVRQQENF